MSKINWQDVVVSPETSLREAIARMNTSALQVGLVLDTNQNLAGILTDGDVRRAILAGISLDIDVSKVMNPNPTTISLLASRTDMLALMRRKVIHHLPIVDEKDRVVGLATLDDLIGAVERPNWVVLMAGGLGTRLRPLTKERPKPMLTVGGKPILEIIIESFAAQGFKNIFVSVNYKADMIEDYFQGGEQWGVHLTYLHEQKRLGTAGALSLLPKKPKEPIIVMNADILTQMSFDSLLLFHQSENSLATMAVREYDFQVPYGVVRVDETKIQEIEEKPVQRFFVNAGIYVLSPEALDLLPEDTFFDMPTLFEELIAAGQCTTAYPLQEYWLDIGRLEEFERAQVEWNTDS
ncbi:nucleotidyltransferase family protein [Limnospira sp. PMC 1042.18]|uniref:nucleotidyltransferase family protein n=1 Tax=Limnospira sp. PMC 1042.18 TaxID=2981018 RepID=UPI0028E15D78|nr:nucleotidyltransferase family protein [Limnospira sp. PMC 1042.18]MDT9198033.1 nucleotidyltransferase family protein [Limnospira sp. PMC 1042.18]